MVADDEVLLGEAITAAFREHDAIILSGGTSKGAGDLTYKIVGGLGSPGIVAHGVALKLGKPLCLAVADGKPVVVLPGFPTSAMFIFHDIVAPVPVRVPSELGRTEFVMVALAQDADGYVAHPIGKGSGAVTAFSQADGFLTIDALNDALTQGTRKTVQLFGAQVNSPDLVIMGSPCTGLNAIVSGVTANGLSARVLALGGLGALKRGECDIAPIHLMDPDSGVYDTLFLSGSMVLIPGWRRMQGFVFRKGDARFDGKTLDEAVAAALADPDCIVVNRNQGAGTRTLINQLLKGGRPQGYWNQPRSHNAVTASIAQARADWGIAIRPVAEALGLGFIPLAEEHYDFAMRTTLQKTALIEAFRALLVEREPTLRKLGFEPAPKD